LAVSVGGGDGDGVGGLLPSPFTATANPIATAIANRAREA